MNRNIEIKARVSDRIKLSRLAGEISSSPAVILIQKDIYYNIKSGRLKLRIINDEKAELIFYTRENIKGPKYSTYSIYETKNHEGLDLILGPALGRIGIVEKTRKLYMLGQTRIHLDDVKNLGFFVELEVVLRENQNNQEGIEIAGSIMNRLGILNNQLLELSYIDLIVSNNETQKSKN